MSQTHNENSRVNRIYKSYRYGYVVDFADIEREFDKTNRAYWDELSNELGDEIGSYSQLFKTAEEIEQEIADIKNALFDFDTENAEEFCSQISQIEDKKTASSPKKSPANPAARHGLRHPHPVGTMAAPPHLPQSHDPAPRKIQQQPRPRRSPRSRYSRAGTNVAGKNRQPDQTTPPHFRRPCRV